MAVAGSYYGRERFDPLLILAQIVLLQACFYTSYLILLVIFNRATGTVASLTAQIFNHTYVTLRHFPGWVTCSALVISAAGPTALAFVAIVGRAKRCVDFACTLLISHIIATTIHSGFPNNIMWWLINVLATSAMAAVGEALSLRIELREISVRRDGGRVEKKDSGIDLETGADSSEVTSASASEVDIEKGTLMMQGS